MTDETNRNLKLYVQAQLAEMQEHQYFLSEEQGRAVSLEEACTDWIETGHAERFKDVYLSRVTVVEPALQRMIDRGQPVTVDVVHRLLGDYDAGRTPNSYRGARHSPAA